MTTKATKEVPKIKENIKKYQKITRKLKDKKYGIFAHIDHAGMLAHIDHASM